MKLRYEANLRDFIETFRVIPPFEVSAPLRERQYQREVSEVSEFQLSVTHDVRVSFRAAAIPGQDGPEIAIGNLRASVDPYLLHPTEWGPPSALSKVLNAQERERAALSRAEFTEGSRRAQSALVDRWIHDLKSRKRGVRRRAKRKLEEIGSRT